MSVLEKDFDDDDFDDSDWDGFWDDPEEFVVSDEDWEQLTQEILEDEEEDD